MLRAVTVLIALFLFACARNGEVRTLHGETMGTTWSVKLVAPAGADLDAIHAGIQDRLDRIVAQMSTWEADSTISRYNRAEAGSWIDLEPEFLRVLSRALDLARDSGGAYDPTVGPLVNLWGFGPGQRRHATPDADEISRVKATIGWRRLVLDRAGSRLQQPGGLYLDLSSVAKGYAVDDVGDFLWRSGYRDTLVEIGGELRGRGRKPDGSVWQVALERPGSGAGEASLAQASVDDDALMLTLRLADRAVATSGDYRHVFERDGRRYSHHIDPRSGYPVPYRVASVSVIAASGLEADPIGTTLIVLGPDAGLRWASERGIAALMVLHAGNGLEQRMTPAFAAQVSR